MSDECLLGQRLIKESRRTLVLACFIGGVRDKSLKGQRGRGGGVGVFIAKF